MKSVLIGLCCIFCTFPSFANTYYLSSSGNDGSSGLSVINAWRTISKLNSIDLNPGDSVLFESGSSFTGNIYIDDNDAGTPAQPVYFGSYGSGRANILAGTGIGMQAYNCSGIFIANLNFTGAGATMNTARGLDFFMDAQANLPFIKIDNCDISGFRGNGIQLGCWDTNFGYTDVSVTHVNSFNNGSGGMGCYGFNDVINHKNFYVAYCTFHDNHGRADVTTSHTGNGIVLGGIDNVTIEYCEAYNNGDLNTNPSGGPVGIWFYLVRNGVIQFCESHHNSTGTIDGGGFDIDGGSQNCVIQYCYSHDNAGAGYLMAEYGASVAYSNNVIRYNISQNDARKGSSGAIAFWGIDNAHRINQSQVYNNTVFVNANNVVSGTPAAVKLMGNSFAGVKLCNNIFYTNGAANLLSADIAVDSSSLHFVGNNYYAANGQPAFVWAGNFYNTLFAWKSAAVSQERSGIYQFGLQGDPMLVSPGNAGNAGVAQLAQLPIYLSAYKLQQNSIALDAGLKLNASYGISIGARDFFGNAPLFGASQDAGAHECNDCYVVLPQNSISFNARKDQQAVNITWQLRDESPVEKFVVQFSDDGVDFKILTTVNAGGDGTHYSVQDPVYFVHERFYRLQVIQKNGARINSRVVAVYKESNPGFDIQVLNGPSIIFTSDVQQILHLRLYSTDGKLVYQQDHVITRGTTHYNFDKKIAPGVYILHAAGQSGASRAVRLLVNK